MSWKTYTEEIKMARLEQKRQTKGETKMRRKNYISLVRDRARRTLLQQRY